jgi:hypothetical protein
MFCGMMPIWLTVPWWASGRPLRSRMLPRVGMSGRKRIRPSPRSLKISEGVQAMRQPSGSCRSGRAFSSVIGPTSDDCISTRMAKVLFAPGSPMVALRSASPASAAIPW